VLHPPPQKKPTQERRNPIRKDEDTVAMAVPAPYKTGDRTNPTMPPHTPRKIPARAKKKGIIFGLSGMPHRLG